MDELVVPCVTRLRVRNFASIAECDVVLGPLTVLVGFNAAGKSSFLDALRFLADALATSPGRALSSRGGLERVLHRTADNRSAESFTIEVDLQLASDVPGKEPMVARYSVEIGRDWTNRFPLVKNETCEGFAVGPDGLRRRSRRSTRPMSGRCTTRYTKRPGVPRSS
jgi:predicted ATPase